LQSNEKEEVNRKLVSATMSFALKTPFILIYVHSGTSNTKRGGLRIAKDVYESLPPDRKKNII
jgi:hypothetical protein